MARCRSAGLTTMSAWCNQQHSGRGPLSLDPRAVATALAIFRNFQKEEDSVDKFFFSTSQLAAYTHGLPHPKSVSKGPGRNPKRLSAGGAMILSAFAENLLLPDPALSTSSGLSQGILRRLKDCYYFLFTDREPENQVTCPRSTPTSYSGACGCCKRRQTGKGEG